MVQAEAIGLLRERRRRNHSAKQNDGKQDRDSPAGFCSFHFSILHFLSDAQKPYSA